MICGSWTNRELVLDANGEDIVIVHDGMTI